jgi:hypothetical protein
MCEFCRRKYGDWQDNKFFYALTALYKPLRDTPTAADFIEEPMLLDLPILEDWENM